jgi:hypothetical protein
VLQERINPFDKNKPPVVDTKPSVTGFYTSSVSSSNNTTILPTSKVVDATSKPSSASVTTSIISSGFDYSYKPTTTTTTSFPTSYITQKSIDKEEELKKADIKPMSDETTSSKTAPVRGKFERKLSDADIIFGGKTDPYISSTFNTFSRNRSNSSFTSTSTDSEYNTTSRDVMKRENPLQKSLSVSSEKDGDFASDPRVKSYQGITNSAFQDSFDSPRASSISKPWSNNHDEDFDLK